MLLRCVEVVDQPAVQIENGTVVSANTVQQCLQHRRNVAKTSIEAYVYKSIVNDLQAQHRSGSDTGYIPQTIPISVQSLESVHHLVLKS